MEIVLLLAAGVILGRVWAWLKTQNEVIECPRCAVEDRKRQVITDISSLRRASERQMYEAGQQPRTSSPQRRSYGAKDELGQRFGGER